MRIMQHGLTRLSLPLSEPITLNEVKSHLRISASQDDTLLTRMITVAREDAESYTRRSFITQQWKLYLDSWDSGGAIELPLSPLLTVESIAVKDSSGNLSSYNSDQYDVITYQADMPAPGIIALKDGAIAPAPGVSLNGIEISYTSGYGDAASVPSRIAQAMLEEIAFRYEHRGDARSSDVVSPSARSLLKPYRVVRL